jgi:hypothetical protein
VEQQAGVASGSRVGILQLNHIHAGNSVVDLACRTADSQIRRHTGVLAGHALPIGRIEQCARRVDIYTLSQRIQVLVRLAALKEDALAVLEPIVGVGAAGAQSQLVNYEAVLRVADALAVHTPLRRTAAG